MNNQPVSFLPFHAINEFMRPDYRDEIIRTVLTGLPIFTVSIRINLERAINTYVHIPGFRKSIKAPQEIIQIHLEESFKKTATITALVISAWTDIHPGLRDKVFQLLSSLHWELLPQSADRTILPGFYTTWPKGQEFDYLFESYKNQFPGDETSKDDICLMIVWLACRLPYEFKENIF
jgi:hypothetical protein